MWLCFFFPLWFPPLVSESVDGNVSVLDCCLDAGREQHLAWLLSFLGVLALVAAWSGRGTDELSWRDPRRFAFCNPRFASAARLKRAASLPGRAHCCTSLPVKGVHFMVGHVCKAINGA